MNSDGPFSPLIQQCQNRQEGDAAVGMNTRISSTSLFSSIFKLYWAFAHECTIFVSFPLPLLSLTLPMSLPTPSKFITSSSVIIVLRREMDSHTYITQKDWEKKTNHWARLVLVLLIPQALCIYFAINLMNSELFHWPHVQRTPYKCE